MNAVIAQSGGPTAVINHSLAGCIEALRRSGGPGRIFGARHAVRGMVEDDLIDLTDIPQDELARLAATPSAALGSSRDKPDEAYCERIVESLARRDIRLFFYIGGNDSANTCRIVKKHADARGHDMRAFHIPKTIDNDLVLNDHCPGYGSAARYVAKAFLGDSLDNRALPGVKINIVMGRHAGFLTAASGLARQHEDDGPHLIYVPERVFDLAQFCGDVEAVYERLGRCQVAVSEGVRDADRNLISAVMSSLNEKDAHGNVALSGSGALGDFLADQVRTSLGIARVRADTLGYAQRSFPDPSPVDQREARAVGAEAVRQALGDAQSGSITIERVAHDPYQVEYGLAKLEDVAGETRTLPDAFIAGGRPWVSDSFIEYAMPLVGELPLTGRFLR